MVNIRRAAEGAAAFLVLEAVGALSGNPVASIPVALGIGGLIYRQGINADTEQTMLADIKQAFGLNTATPPTATTPQAGSGSTPPTTPAPAPAPAAFTLSVDNESPAINDTIHLTVANATGPWQLYYGSAANPVAIGEPQKASTLLYVLSPQSPLGDALSVFDSLPIFAKVGTLSTNTVTLALE